MATNTSSSQGPLLSLQTSHLIGRADLLNELRAAINDPSGKCYTFYFNGKGGIGKTRLLKEIDVIKSTWKGRPFRSTKIIDLYHAVNHSPSGLRGAIVDGLDPGNEFFHGYRLARKEHRDQRDAGLFGAPLEELRQKAIAKFQEEYESLSKKYRLVIRFDTLELIQHESDVVQRVCQVDDTDTIIKHWMLNQLIKLPNTVILFAGRPQPPSQQQIIELFGEVFVAAGHQFKRFDLQTFSRDETEAYLEDLYQQRPKELTPVLTAKNKEKLYEVTKGRPIYLALLVDFANWRVSEPFPEPVDETDLRRKLVDMLERDNRLPVEMADMINLLVVARKGLDYKLLKHLVGDQWSPEKMHESMEQVRQLAIVKVREDSSEKNIKVDVEHIQLFLHDEVYDLFDEYYKEDQHYGEKFIATRDYYRNKIDPNITAQEREEWQTAQLYYEFQVDPRVGYYQCYARWDEEVIKTHEVDADMRLRDEGLRFMNRYTSQYSDFKAIRVLASVNRDDIDRDCAVRWVKRYVSRGEMNKASQVAEAIRNSKESVFNWDVIDDPLYKAGLLTAWGESLVYTADKQTEAFAILREAIQMLNTERHWNDDQKWWQARILGRAYNNIGYLHRTEGRYGLARQQYQHALKQFTEAQILDEEADTRNNLAFVLACLGRLTAARKHIEQSLKFRESDKKPYPLALGKNTLGYIYILEDLLDYGISRSKEALKTFEDFRAPRGVGLACINLGFGFRKKGDRWKLGEPLSDAEKYFGEAVTSLKRAIAIFSEDVREPIRLWEALNELGSVYCDWGWLARQEENGWQVALEYYDQAIQYQEKAKEIVESKGLKFQLADALDDLAQVHSDRSFLLIQMDRKQDAQQGRAMADALLDRVEQMIPSEFKLIPGKGFGEAPEPGEAYWLSLGKVHLWRSIWMFRDLDASKVSDNQRQEKQTSAILNLIEAVAYFHRYDETRSYPLQRTLRYFSDFIQRHHIPTDRVRKLINEFTEKYLIDLKVLFEAADDMLGV